MLLAFLSHASPVAAPGERSDALFVFAGHPARKEYAAALWRAGDVPRLVLAVGRFEWRRYAALGVPGAEALAAAIERTPPPERFFFVIVEGARAEVRAVPIRRFGTRNEARALAALAKERGWRSVTVLSSGFHMRRVALATRRAFRGTDIAVAFAALPAASDPYGAGRWWRRPRGVRLVLREGLKLILYRFFLRP